MIDSDQEIEEIAKRLVQASTTRNVEMFADVLADDATVWHSDDEEEMPRNTVLRHFAATLSSFKNWDWEDIKRSHIPGGYVQEYTLRAMHASGHSLRLLCCIIVAVRNGKIHRIREYLDPTPLRELQKVSGFQSARAQRILAHESGKS
jgi:ketosteroid isomerase-like protein